MKRTFGYNSRGCPLSQKFRNIRFHSPHEICGDSNRKFFGRMESARCINKKSVKNLPLLPEERALAFRQRTARNRERAA